MKIEIPKEALDAEELTDDLGDDWTGDLDLGEEPEEEEEVSADLRTDDNGNYILTDWEEKKEVSVKTVEPFQIIDYSSNDSLMFEYLPQTESESVVTVIYSMEEVDEYTEEDILASIKGNKEIYEMKEEFSDIVYQEPVELSVGDKEAKYASLRCKKRRRVCK